MLYAIGTIIVVLPAMRLAWLVEIARRSFDQERPLFPFPDEVDVASISETSGDARRNAYAALISSTTSPEASASEYPYTATSTTTTPSARIVQLSGAPSRPSSARHSVTSTSSTMS